MKKIQFVILCFLISLSLLACQKEKEKLPIDAEIVFKQEIYYDNQKLYFIVQAQNIIDDQSAVVMIAPERDYISLSEANENQVYKEYLTKDNTIIEVDLSSKQIPAGKWMIVVGDYSQNKIVENESFKVIETSVVKDGWGDAHSDVYWEEKFPGHDIETFTIYIDKIALNYHFDKDRHQTLMQWIDSEMNVDGWLIVDKIIVSPDKAYKISNTSTKLDVDCVYDCESYKVDGGNFVFKEITNKKAWPKTDFFIGCGLPSAFADVDSIKSISYTFQEDIKYLDGKLELIIDVKTDDFDLKDAYEEFAKDNNYQYMITNTEQHNTLICNYVYENEPMRFIMIELAKDTWQLRFICAPYDV